MENKNQKLNTVENGSIKPKREYSNNTIYQLSPMDNDHPYLKITQNLLKDKNLNATDIGVMVLILNHPSSYIFNKEYFQQESGLGRITYNNSIDHLKELGYLSIIKKQGGYTWIITDSILTTTETCGCEISRPTEPVTVNSRPSISRPTDPATTGTCVLLTNDNLEINKKENNNIINNNIINNINKEYNKKDNNIMIDNLEQLEQPTVEVPVEKIYQPSNHSFLNFPRGLKVTKEVKEVNVIEEDEFSTKAIQKELEATEEPKEIYLIFKKWFSNAPGTPSDKVYDFKTIFSTEKILLLGEYMEQAHITGHSAIKRVINEVTVAAEEEEDKEDEMDYEENERLSYQY